MPLKLRRVLHDINAIQAIEWYHTVFVDEADIDILNFHDEPLALSVYNFENRVRLLDELDEHVYFVLNSKGNVAGYACAYQPRWEGYEMGREFGIFIKNKYRNRGYGTKGIAALEALYDAPHILSPQITNTAAIRLYEGLGYTTEATLVDSPMLLTRKLNLG